MMLRRGIRKTTLVILNLIFTWLARREPFQELVDLFESEANA